MNGEKEQHKMKQTKKQQHFFVGKLGSFDLHTPTAEDVLKLSVNGDRIRLRTS